MPKEGLCAVCAVQGISALGYAVWAGHLATTKVLIEYGLSDWLSTAIFTTHLGMVCTTYKNGDFLFYPHEWDLVGLKHQTWWCNEILWVYRGDIAYLGMQLRLLLWLQLW